MQNNKQQRNHIDKHITIKHHAQMRLEERIGSYEGFRSWQHFAKAARFEGTPLQSLEAQPGWIKVPDFHFKNNSRRIMYYRGWFWVFAGNNHHARTLITVFRPDWLAELSEDSNLNKEISEEF